MGMLVQAGLVFSAGESGISPSSRQQLQPQQIVGTRGFRHCQAIWMNISLLAIDTGHFKF